MQDLRRLSAFGATAAAAFGAAGLLTAVSGSEFFRYVSESGIPGARRSTLYLTSTLLIAVALALLVAPATRTARFAAPALALAAPLAAVSSVVTCSPGCPLPPFEATTPRDLLHAAAAIGALLLCGFTMLVYAAQPVDSPLRRTGRLGLAVAVPLLGLAAIGIVFAGRGLYSGIMERAALVATCSWLIVTAALHLRVPAVAPRGKVAA